MALVGWPCALDRSTERARLGATSVGLQALGDGGAGRGVGGALIEWLRNAMRAEGWARLYWMTAADNAQARRLYDRFSQADGFVRYVVRQR